MHLLSHTPPRLPIGSIGREPSQMKRIRSGSVSGRLRSASQLFEDGAISQTEKGKLKEMIIAEDPKAAELIERYDKGDKGVLKELGGHSGSIDLMDDLSLDILNFGDTKLSGSLGGSTPKDGMLKELFNMDDDWEGPGSYGANSLGSVKPLSVKSGELQGNGAGMFGTPPADLFDFDLFGGDGNNDTLSGLNLNGSLGGFGSASGSLDLVKERERDALVELEELTDSFSNKNKDRSASSMSLGAAFRDDYSGDSRLGDGSNSSKSTPMAIPKQSAKPRATQNVNIPNRNSSQINANRTSGAYPITNKGQKPPLPKKNTQPVINYNKETSQSMQAQQGLKPGQSSSTQANASNGYPPITVTGHIGQVGAYSPNSRRMRIEKFLQKRQHRVWKKRVKYDVRKNFADSRLRVKGRFVKKEDEELLRDYLLMTF